MPQAELDITAELAERRQPSGIAPLEKLSVRKLAEEMLIDPSKLLPSLAEVAMDISGSTSAGLSILEAGPGPGVFRWRHVRGALERFEGSTIPRGLSPCGVTLDRNAAVLMRNPDIGYDWGRNAGIPLAEVLLIPFTVEKGVQFGTLWVVSQNPGHYHEGHVKALTELAAFAGIALKMSDNEKRLREALEQQETLSREMSHRVKNVFAITDAMVRMSGRKASTVQDMTESLSRRIHALASAHSLVRKQFDHTGLTRSSIGLNGLLEKLLQAYDQKNIAIQGDPIDISPSAINSIALFFHELATNSAKYGALGTETGHLAISWIHEDGNIAITWLERGGPKIEKPPEKIGFGTLLAQRTIKAGLGGNITTEWARDGLKVVVSIPPNKLSL